MICNLVPVQTNLQRPRLLLGTLLMHRGFSLTPYDFAIHKTHGKVVVLSLAPSLLSLITAQFITWEYFPRDAHAMWEHFPCQCVCVIFSHAMLI
jgi:hypothetical protein